VTNLPIPEPSVVMPAYSLQSIVSQVTDIYTMPEAALKARKLLSDPDVAIADLVRVISTDQGLAAKVLRVANSSFYARLRRVETLREAIMTIGLRNIQSIVLSHVAKDFNNQFGSGEYAIWEHSLATAVICVSLAEKTRRATIEDALLAGLLHDIGKTILCTALPDEFNAIAQAVYERDLGSHVAEAAVLGFSHADVGGATSKIWRFPEKVTAGVAYHHALKSAQSQASDHLALVCIINLADHYARALGFSIRPTPETMDWSGISSARALKLTPQALDDMREPLIRRIEEERSIFD